MNKVKQLFASILLLSSVSAVTTVKAAVEVTFLGNMGFLLSDGKDKIIIDGFLAEAYALFEGLDEHSVQAMVSAKDDFQGIDIALASHIHFEHFQPDMACLFIKASKSTQFISSPQVITILRERCKPFAKNHKNVKTVTVRPGVPQSFSREGVTVEIFPLTHGTGKFAALHHFGHLMTVGGKTILHIGDAAAVPVDFIAAGLQNRKLDILLAPYTFFTRSAGKAMLAQYMQAPVQIVSHIPPKEFTEISEAVLENYPGAIIFQQRMEKQRFE
ncbi:MAG: MBL fold metallo-hydrolase [Xanthomonadales bacterium]|nr:MBL fold metallo-hydrolase [Xanthomonadales bacterium]